MFVQKKNANNWFDNTVYLYTCTALNEQEIELVKFYFQASNYSGGDDAVEARYDAQKNVLEINYVKNVTKQEILRRRRFSFGSYVFEALESRLVDYHAVFVKLKNTLVFENINRSGCFDDVSVYINFLVRNNVILKMEYSNIMENLMYVEFREANFNFDEIQTNLARRPMFRNNLVQIHEAFETNSVLLKINNAKVKQFVDYLNKNFMIKDHCYWQVPFDYDDSPFIIIKFKNTLTKHRFLSGFLVSDIKDVCIENVYNVNVLNRYLDDLRKRVFNDFSMIEYTEGRPMSSTSATAFNNDNTVITEKKKTLSNATKHGDPFKHKVKELRKIKKEKQKEVMASTSFKQVVTKPKSQETKACKRTVSRPKNYPKQCEHCPFKAYQQQSLKRHAKGHEMQQGRFKCTFCNFFSDFKLSIHNHEIAVHFTVGTDNP